MRSMTGFGRAELEAPFGQLAIEIQSVNRKYFELQVSLPKEFARFEQAVRKQFGERSMRGSVSVRIYAFPNSLTIKELVPDETLLRQLKKGWEHCANSLGYGSQAIDLRFLVEQASALPSKSLGREEYWAPISACLDEALSKLDTMKRQEGGVLAREIASRLQTIADLLNRIEELTPNAVEKLRQKLTQRMGEVLQPGAELDDRLLREVALYAERVDITEEISRFRSHLAQYSEATEGPVGRKLDFLTQEMGREINTIGSKAMDAQIAHFVIDVKSELEKVREQIQNIE